MNRELCKKSINITNRRISNFRSSKKLFSSSISIPSPITLCHHIKIVSQTLSNSNFDEKLSRINEPRLYNMFCDRRYLSSRSTSPRRKRNTVSTIKKMGLDFKAYVNKKHEYNTAITGQFSNSNSGEDIYSKLSPPNSPQRLSMVTGYDYSAGYFLDDAGINIILVGDSLANTMLGHSTTQYIGMEEMLHHCKAVVKGKQAAHNTAFIVGDMPYGSYEYDLKTGVTNAYRFMKEAHVDAVKIEGGTARRCELVQELVGNCGIPVMGHIGLTPQAVSVIGGYKVAGRTIEEVEKLLFEAKALEEAGAFSVVLECVPSLVGKLITSKLNIPTISVGGGRYTTGQCLVYHDMLGLTPSNTPPPSFVKKYADLKTNIQDALQTFKKEVQDEIFPGEEYSGYQMLDKEQENQLLEKFPELAEIDTQGMTGSVHGITKECSNRKGVNQERTKILTNKNRCELKNKLSDNGTKHQNPYIPYISPQSIQTTALPSEARRNTSMLDKLY